jgi:hypothetical protein
MRRVRPKIAVGWVAGGWAACVALALFAAARAEQAGKEQIDPVEAQQREQAKQLAVHWEQQLSRLLFSHLELLRGICGDLPRDTRRAIAKAGEEMVKEATIALAEAQLGGRPMRRAAVAAGKPAGARKPGPPTTVDIAAARIADAIGKAVADRVGKEQAAAFAAELAARNDRRKQAAIEGCVAMVDAHVILSPAQREAISGSLSDRWNDEMLMKLRVVHRHHGRLIFDQAVNARIVPHLDDSQRKVFSGPANERMEIHVGGQSPMADMLGRMNPPLPRDPWWFQ